MNKDQKCQAPLCKKEADFLVVIRPDQPNEIETPMCWECAKKRKDTASQYNVEVLITVLD